MDVKIDSEKCIFCRVCVINCPKNNLFLESGFIVSKGKCCGCKACVAMCPKACIEVSND